MTVSDSAYEDLSKPSLPRFLIALFLAKSKPATCSVSGTSNPNTTPKLDQQLNLADYICSLRARIDKGRRPTGLAGAENHVDSAAFWRDAFEKSEKTQLKLRERILHLEWQQGNMKVGSSSQSTSQIKRKRSFQSIQDVTNASSQKRSRKAAVDPKSCKSGHLEGLVDEAVWSASEHDRR